ncbi:MAG TPA: YtxH domain-containing protein [Bryobacteraceae bacterium]|jgi:gas vesicle protein|nr:YtxH domain-containing protein [Bryobacteraceae bacterium]
MERNNTGAIVGWFLGGALIGAAVALLVAPQTGERTRKLLGKQAEKGRKSLLESGQDILARGRELYERGREIAEETAELFERGRRIAEKTIEDRL